MIRRLLLVVVVFGALLSVVEKVDADPVTPKPGHDILDPYRDIGVPADEQRLRNIAEYERWRAEIFDYDRRLFERVKKLNNTNVELRRMVGFSSVIIILMLGALLFFVIKRRPQVVGVSGDANEPTERKTIKSALSPQSALQALDRYRAKQILSRQKKLMRSVEEITPYLQEFGEDGKRLAKAISSETIALQSEIDAALAVKPEQ